MASAQEELYTQRAKRIQDAIDLKVPDRVPTLASATYFALSCASVSVQDAMYDYDKAHAAFKRMFEEIQWDGYCAPSLFSGFVFEHLASRQLRWAGHGVGSNTPYQFVEPGQILGGREVYPPMQTEHYDWFLDDPSDYMIRSYFPNIFGALAPFKNLPPIHGIICWYQGLFEALATIGAQETLEAFGALCKAGAEALNWLESFLAFIEQMKDCGYPSFVGSVTHAPFDFIANYLRGTRETMIDMFTNADKLIKACEKVTPWMITAASEGAEATGIPAVAIYLHKGFDSMMSEAQYRTFYWPTLRDVIIGIIDNGLTPWVYTEGSYASRLKIINDVPRGKAIFHLEQDLIEAKKIFGEMACLTGGPPNTMLRAGTPDEVRDYCKKLFDVVGKGGGYILAPSVPLIDEKIENVRAMVEFAQEYRV